MSQNNFKLIFKTFLLSLMIIANVHFAYAQTASILPPAKTTFFDANGNPLVNGKVDFYIPGTTTRKTTWQDSGESIPNANPLTLDAAGRALILGDGSYRQVVRDRNNNVIWDATTSSTGTGGGGVTATVGDGDLVGTVKPWAGMTAPVQYAFAYGQEFTRTSFPLLFSTLTTQQNASCTIGVAALTGLSDTSNIPIGSPIESSCLSAGTTVLTKTTTTVTTSANAIVSTTTTARFFPYGNGDGSTTFNVPDLRGKVVAGRCNMGGASCTNITSAFFGVNPNALSSGGTESKQLIAAQLPLITGQNSNIFNVSVASNSNTLADGFNSGVNTSASGAGFNVASSSGPVTIGVKSSSGNVAIGVVTTSSTNTNATANGAAHSVVQPTQLLNYIIKTLPDTNANSFFGVAEIGGMTGVIACGAGLTCAGNTISAVVGTLPNQAPNTALANVTAISASPTAVALPSCSTASSALTYTTNTGFGCNVFSGSTVTIASGAKALATGAITSATCTSAQTDTATGAATTDAIIVSFNGDPTAVTGYIPSTAGMLTIIPYPTLNTVNFKVCNNTLASITPGAITINWRIVR